MKSIIYSCKDKFADIALTKEERKAERIAAGKDIMKALEELLSGKDTMKVLKESLPRKYILKALSRKDMRKAPKDLHGGRVEGIYREIPERIAAQNRYEESPKGIAAWKRCYESPERITAQKNVESHMPKKNYQIFQSYWFSI